MGRGTALMTSRVGGSALVVDALGDGEVLTGLSKGLSTGIESVGLDGAVTAVVDGASGLAVAVGVKNFLGDYIVNGGLAVVGSEVLFLIFMFFVAKNVNGGEGDYDVSTDENAEVNNDNGDESLL
ncbi:hypothetical protein TrST_g6503 [Triparma strigata]|uniref:Uncharacterized protein n=1 Tax=Triparma strigata TaxID=1606541 RepID=A0A9W7EHW2_9STRA|nr:hypothetical protein TrST_g6503 [Triparma strigata]